MSTVPTSAARSTASLRHEADRSDSALIETSPDRKPPGAPTPKLHPPAGLTHPPPPITQGRQTVKQVVQGVLIARLKAETPAMQRLGRQRRARHRHPGAEANQ